MSIISVGGRIKHFRVKGGKTQKEVGINTGFSPPTADIRIAQYENGTRTPSQKTLTSLAKALNIPAQVLSVPRFNSPAQLMQMLFALEDTYTFTTAPTDFCLMLHEWKSKREELNAGKISRHEYDKWRYEYSPNDFGT